MSILQINIMEKITCTAEIKIAIQNLEFQQDIQGKLMKEEFLIAFESLKPVHLIKSILQEVTSSPYLLDNMLGSVMGMITGYISRKITVGGSHNLIRKVVGSLLQFGVTNVVAQHTEVLKWAGNFFMQHVLHKSEKNISRR